MSDELEFTCSTRNSVLITHHSSLSLGRGSYSLRGFVPSVCDSLITRLIIFPRAAGVAKLVYAPDSKSGEVKLMSVRVRPPAPNLSNSRVKQRISLMVHERDGPFLTFLRKSGEPDISERGAERSGIGLPANSLQVRKNMFATIEQNL